MQARRKLLPILLVILALFVAAMAVAACGGSGEVDSRGQTWMNFPSVPVNVDANGAANIYGLGIGQVHHARQVAAARGAQAVALAHRLWRCGLRHGQARFTSPRCSSTAAVSSSKSRRSPGS